MFLDASELADLTGYRQSAAQVRWLRKNGITHYVRADGQVRVPRSFFADRETKAVIALEPNYAALQARH
jgi:Domain of unknown function (DUF4224)